MKKLVQYSWGQLRIAVGGFLKQSRELPQRYPEYEIGRGSYGPLQIETFGDDARLKIGAFCSFAKGVTILLGGEHRTEWVSTFPFDRRYFNASGVPHSSFARGDVVIGNDVWIGEGALILSGATIGDGAVIAARSVVRGDIPPYAICAGIPARVLKFRFPPDVIRSLLNIQWWHWPDERIRSAIPLLMSGRIEEFCKQATL